MAQWQKEIKKACGDELVVDYYDYKTMKFTRNGEIHSRGKLGDIVLTTYNALEKKNVASQLNDRQWGRVVLDEMQVRDFHILFSNLTFLKCRKFA